MTWGLPFPIVLHHYDHCNKPVPERTDVYRVLRSIKKIPPGAWLSVCCEYFVLSGTGLCDELVTRREDSNRVW
jgi:hypothetical protein